MVSLLISQGGNSYSSCGGSIINDRFILTAAHCLAENSNPNSVIAMLGAHSNDERMRSGNGRLQLKVKSCRVHENYDHNGSKMDDDIALCELAQPVIFDDTVNPICLPNTSKHPRLFVTGWGRQNVGRSRQLTSAKVLYEVEIDEVDNTTCRVKYWGNTFKPEKEICAGLIKSTCQGDSGGPLSYVDDEGVTHQVGIVSFGTPQCGVADNPKPAVYERVMAHLQWIEKHTRGAKWCSGPNTPAFTHRNIAKAGRSYKNGGQSTASASSPASSRASALPQRPVAPVSSVPGLSNLPSGSGTIRIIRVIGPDGKITQRIERSGNSNIQLPRGLFN